MYDGLRVYVHNVCVRAHKHEDVCVCPRPNVLAIQTLPGGVNPSRDLIRDGTRTGPKEFLVSVGRIGQARLSKLCGSRKSRPRRSSLRGSPRFPRIRYSERSTETGLMLICIDYRWKSKEIELKNVETRVHFYYASWELLLSKISYFQKFFQQ